MQVKCKLGFNQRQWALKKNVKTKYKWTEFTSLGSVETIDVRKS